MRYLIVLLLAGCATQSGPFTGPNGKEAYSFRCGNRPNLCYEAAGKACAKGYTVIGASTGTAMTPTPIGTMGAPQNQLAIECK